MKPQQPVRKKKTVKIQMKMKMTMRLRMRKRKNKKKKKKKREEKQAMTKTVVLILMTTYVLASVILFCLLFIYDIFIMQRNSSRSLPAQILLEYYSNKYYLLVCYLLE